MVVKIELIYYFLLTVCDNSVKIYNGNLVFVLQNYLMRRLNDGDILLFFEITAEILANHCIFLVHIQNLVPII
jgi:hypothetical protein